MLVYGHRSILTFIVIYVVLCPCVRLCFTDTYYWNIFQGYPFELIITTFLVCLCWSEMWYRIDTSIVGGQPLVLTFTIVHKACDYLNLIGTCYLLMP